VSVYSIFLIIHTAIWLPGAILEYPATDLTTTLTTNPNL
jgi:hypothetical protein